MAQARHRRGVDPRHTLLREALAAYGLDTRKLNQLATYKPAELKLALNDPAAPPQVTALLTILGTLLVPEDKPQIKSPTDAAALLMLEMGHLEQEQLRVICVDTKNRVQAVKLVYQGNVNSAVIRVSEVLQPAIILNSPAFLLAHNHPSGDATPSPEDVSITRQILESARSHDIDLLDHLVIGQGRFVSLRERGLGFGNEKPFA